MECPPNIHRASTERHAVGCAFLGWACFGRVPFCGLWSLVASFSSLDARGPFACQLLLVLIALPQRFGLKPLHLLLTMHLLLAVHASVCTPCAGRQLPLLVRVRLARASE